MPAGGLVLGATLLDAQRASTHCLPAPAIAVSVDGPLEVGCGRLLRSSAFLLGAGQPHTGAAAGRHAIVLLDDLDDRTRALVASHATIDGHAPWLLELRQAVATHAAQLEQPGVVRGVVEDVLKRASRDEDWRAPPVDRRVRAALETIELAARSGEPLPTPLLCGISPAHLRALFRRDMGRTISQHARARRLLAALARLEAHRGQTATTAAHDAGFADGAHLSRTTRSAFGLTLRQLRAATSLRG